MPPLPPALGSRLPLLPGVVGCLHSAGVPIVAGTDAGIVPVKPFDVIPHTIQALGSCGLTNREALAAATSLAAHACGIADHKGVLAAGKDADILAVAGDPLADLRALRDVRAVFRAGVRV
jgi:imidazolonepropionase-like amidohydrolase